MADTALLYSRYGRQSRSAVADSSGRAVLDLGRPGPGLAWLIHHVFVRAASGNIVRLFIGGTPGIVDPSHEVDATSSYPATSGPENLYVGPDDAVWVEVTSVPAGTICYANIRYEVRTVEA